MTERIRIDTIEEYNALMKYLELKGITWSSGSKPSSENYFGEYTPLSISTHHSRKFITYGMSHGFEMSFSEFAERYDIIAIKNIPLGGGSTVKIFRDIVEVYGIRLTRKDINLLKNLTNG